MIMTRDALEKTRRIRLKDETLTNEQRVRFRQIHKKYPPAPFSLSKKKYAGSKTDDFDHMEGNVPGVRKHEREQYAHWYGQHKDKQLAKQQAKVAKWKKTASRWQRIKAPFKKTHPALAEGFVKDVLTYDLSQHHARPHRRFRFNNAAKAKEAARKAVFRNNPYKTQPIKVAKELLKTQPIKTLAKKGSYKLSTARRPGPTVRQRRGRAAVLGIAGATGAGIAAHKLYKKHKERKQMLTREDIIEAIVNEGMLQKMKERGEQRIRKSKREISSLEKKMSKSPKLRQQFQAHAKKLDRRDAIASGALIGGLSYGMQRSMGISRGQAATAAGAGAGLGAFAGMHMRRKLAQKSPAYAKAKYRSDIHRFSKHLQKQKEKDYRAYYKG